MGEVRGNDAYQEELLDYEEDKEKAPDSAVAKATGEVVKNALVRLLLEEVEELTNNFGSKLVPNVYKGVLPNKIMVTVKVLRNMVASERDFQLVASTLGSTHHRNLVALKGFYDETSRKLLLYEYVTNGSLDEYLRRQNKRDKWR